MVGTLLLIQMIGRRLLAVPNREWVKLELDTLQSDQAHTADNDDV